MFSAYILVNEKTNSRFSSEKIAIKAMSAQLIPLLNLWGGKSCGFALSSLLSDNNEIVSFEKNK